MTNDEALMTAQRECAQLWAYYGEPAEMVIQMLERPLLGATEYILNCSFRFGQQWVRAGIGVVDREFEPDDLQDLQDHIARKLHDSGQKCMTNTKSNIKQPGQKMIPPKPTTAVSKSMGGFSLN